MHRVVLCRCSNRKLVNIPEGLEESLRGFAEIVYVDDLCSTVIEKPNADICDENTIVLACHSRATTALLDYANAPKPKKVFDLRSGDGSDFFAYIADLKKAEADANITEIKESSNAWYPCIDYSLCVNCAKCMDFCIFGVYAKVEGKVSVIAPTNCKDNCPACARTCPKGAVIFPKCPDAKISGKQEEDSPKEDFYELLKNRRRRNVLK